MIVDDDRDDRFFFRFAVKELGDGYECREAINGAEALQKLREPDRLPDFIFLDLNMPLMSGKTCLIELKADEKLRHIPVIIYSTSDHWKDKEETRKLGSSYYLTKTSDIFKLSEYILHAINNSGNDPRLV
jgi:CheY-like chemotaxis protein